MNTITEPAQTQHEEGGFCTCPSCMPTSYAQPENAVRTGQGPSMRDVAGGHRSAGHDDPETGPQGLSVREAVALSRRVAAQDASSSLEEPDQLASAMSQQGESEPESVALSPEQQARLNASIRLLESGVAVAPVDDEGLPLGHAATTADDLVNAWQRHPDAYVGMQIPRGCVVLALTDETQPLVESSFGPLADSTLRWEGGGSRYWLLQTSGVNLSYLDGPLAHVWSQGEPWCFLPGDIVRVPSGRDDLGYEWLNRPAGKVPRVPSRLGFALQLRAELEEADLLTQRAEEYDESPPVRAVDELRVYAADDEGGPRGQELIAGLGMQPGTVAMLYGPSQAGKSFIALTHSFHVAAGVPWHGRAVRQGPVYYVAAEGHYTVAERRRAWEVEHGPVGPGFLSIPLRGTDLTTRQGAQRLERAMILQMLPPELIVIDTVAAAMAGHDENGTAALTSLEANARRIAERFGATASLIHHSGKDVSRGSRGSNALPAAVDTVLSAAKVGGRVRLRVEKLRDGQEGETIYLRLVESGPSCVLVADDGPTPDPDGQQDGREDAGPHALVVGAMERLGGHVEGKNKLVAAMDEGCPGRTLHKPQAYELIDDAVQAGAVNVAQGRGRSLVYDLVG